MLLPMLIQCTKSRVLVITMVTGQQGMFFSTKQILDFTLAILDIPFTMTKQQ
jgi:hypothetical protein